MWASGAAGGRVPRHFDRAASPVAAWAVASSRACHVNVGYSLWCKRLPPPGLQYTRSQPLSKAWGGGGGAPSCTRGSCAASRQSAWRLIGSGIGHLWWLRARAPEAVAGVATGSALPLGVPRRPERPGALPRRCSGWSQAPPGGATLSMLIQSVVQAVALCARGCNSMYPRLQPSVRECTAGGRV